MCSSVFLLFRLHQSTESLYSGFCFNMAEKACIEHLCSSLALVMLRL
jgi:hypothetical protein